MMYTYDSQYFALISDLTNRMYSYGHTLQFPNLSTVGLNYYRASYRSYNLLPPPRDGILRQLMICNDMQFDTKIIEPSKVVFKIISPALLSGASPPKAIKQHTKTPIKTHTEACPKKLPPILMLKKTSHFYTIQKSHSASCQPCCCQYP